MATPNDPALLQVLCHRSLLARFERVLVKRPGLVKHPLGSKPAEVSTKHRFLATRRVSVRKNSVGSQQRRRAALLRSRTSLPPLTSLSTALRIAAFFRHRRAICWPCFRLQNR